MPVRPGEITSQAGWLRTGRRASCATIVRAPARGGIRVSLFIDPDPAAVRWAAALGADRIELYTEPYARAFHAAAGPRELRALCPLATLAHELGLGVNAGHDLDLANLALFRALPHLDEVSIGHALISHALFVGLDRSVRDYLAALAA